MSSDDVLELLESIDQPKTAKRKDRKAKKRHNEDLMDFLDEIASEGTPAADTPEPVTSQGPQDTQSPPAQEQKNAGTVEQKTASSTETQSSRDTPRENLPDPIGAVSSWWSKASPGLWEQASKAASRASEAVKQGEQHIGKFDLQSLQKSLTTFVGQIVPPISRHEQLTIHVFHDMAGFPVVDDIVRTVFERVMDQVEGGGDLNMIVQKGVDRHAANSGARSLSLFYGTAENAKKLCLASIDEFRRDNEPKTINGQAEEARISEIFISLQAVILDNHPADNQFQFVCCMSDFTNNVHIDTSSQTMPAEWAEWLGSENSHDFSTADPRDWVLEWVEEAIGLSLGTLAQKYVILRMGIGNASKAILPEA